MIKIALALLLAAFAGNALAADINIGPNGCSLGDAIKAANKDKVVGMCAKGSGVDSIIAPDGWVVTLNSDSPTITTSMTIRSDTSAGTFTIDGDHQHRVLKFTGIETDVTLQNLRIRNGKVGEFQDAGAGIRIVDATVRLDDSSLVENSQISRPARSASGISVTDGDLIIDRSTFDGNGRAPAIYSKNSSVRVTDSVFKANVSGIFSSGGNLLIEGSLIDADVGGVHATNTVIEIVNSTISSSVPQEFSGKYGINAGGMPITLNHVTLTEYAGFHNTLISVSNPLVSGCTGNYNVLLDTGNLIQKRVMGQ